MRSIVFSILTVSLLALVPGYFVIRHFTFQNKVYDRFFEHFKSPTDRPEQFADYRTGAYKNAEANFKTRIEIDTKDTEAWHYLGMCQQYLGKNEEAIASFQKVLDLKDPHLYDAAEWYQALAILKTRDWERVEKRLQDISLSNSDYRSKAKEVLNMLD